MSAADDDQVDRRPLDRATRRAMRRCRARTCASIAHYEGFIQRWRDIPAPKFQAFANIAIEMNDHAWRLVRLYDKTLKAGELLRLDADTMDRIEERLAATERAMYEEDRAQHPERTS